MGIGRNEPCPCGSGKKYKKCCLGKERQSAAQLLDMLKQEIQEQNFDSMEDLQAFVAQRTARENHSGLVDFLGLSPDQMDRMLKRPFDSPHIALFPDMLDNEPQAPILDMIKSLEAQMGTRSIRANKDGAFTNRLCSELLKGLMGAETFERKGPG